MPKTHDLTVTIGEYQDKDGNTKKKRINIGSIIRNDKGNEFIVLNRHFNPAGIPCEAGAESIIVSMWSVEGQEAKPAPQQSRDHGRANMPKTGGSFDDIGDDIPF